MEEVSNPSTKKSHSSWLVRIALLVILGVLAALFWFDFSAAGAADEAYRQLDQALTNRESMTDTQVHDLIGREPDRSAKDSERILREEYDWKSGIRTHTVCIYYQSAAENLLYRVVRK
jgi:hypothetical protein